MNEIERAELEAENDGYRNEFQRAAAWSAMQPVNDDRAYAQALVRGGFFVAVEFSPRYCRITDTIIGEYAHVVRTGQTRKEVLDGIAFRQHDPDCRLEVWPHEVPSRCPWQDDDVPF